jgi:hypothetical protein
MRNRMCVTWYVVWNADDYIGRPIDKDILQPIPPLFTLLFVSIEGLTHVSHHQRGFYRWKRRSWCLCAYTCATIAYVYEMARAPGGLGDI